ncbi:MAG TPA: sigma 54-interacting transcriptional regulator [Polyangia bacterium]|nr:sigma 54-interacting transcriptional regulator [Polyangia bacterium]
MITLEVLAGDKTGATFELDLPVLTLGRAPSNQVVLSDYHLSGEHGQIFREDDRYIYRDLKSTNGSRIRRNGGEIPLDDGVLEQILADGDELLLGDPAQPVIVRCRVKIEDDGRGKQEIIARRDLSELPEVQGKIERERVAALYNVAKKLGRRGLDLASVFDGVAEAIFEQVTKAGYVAIDLADDGRMNTVFMRSQSGARPYVSRSVVRTVQREKGALIIRDVQAELPASSTETKMAITGGIIGVPLWDGETIRGVIQVGSERGVFLGGDLDLVTAVANMATLAIENARLVQRLRLAEEKLRGEVKYLKGREEKRRFSDIIGESSAMAEIFKQLEKVIDTRATVCIEGETGTGKEVIASAIHYQGKRRDKLFVAQNCAAVPETLLESELFGHKKGAFTGADHDKKGLFEIADGGTLFLDEIGEMSINLQAKLLRVLQEGEIRPVGATAPKAVDVRIICATNRSLEKEVEKGSFRQDLFYRLRVFPIRLPPLRERREDVPLLAEHFLRKYTAEMNKAVAGVTPEALDQLAAYSWPGNIRELENEVQRLVIQCDNEGFITPELLAPAVRKVEGLLGRVAPKKGTLKDMMEEVERWLLVEALREHGGNKTKTAETLGITREGLHKKLAKYGM